MSVLDKDKTYSNLLKKGFSKASGDHKYLEFWYDNLYILHTKVSHGSNKDLDDYLVGQMSRQCKLNKSQFSDLARCPLSLDEYIVILKKQNII